MYCYGCEYELAGLAEDRCPECGRVFDADDPSTFASEQLMVLRVRRARRFEMTLIVCALVPMVASVFAYIAFVGARVSLGRWPHRWGRDDPKDIAGIGFFADGAMWILVAVFPTLIVGLVMLIMLATYQANRRLARGGLLAIGMWSCGFMLLRWDLAEVWTWLFD